MRTPARSSIVTRIHRRRRLRAASLAALASLTALAANAADGLRISPGAWEINRLTRVPGEAEPRLRATIECIRDQVVDPAKLAGEMGGCLFVDHVLSEQTLRWRVRCDGKLAGVGELTVASDRAHGGVHIDAGALFQTGFFEAAWSAKRLGPCPETFASERGRNKHDEPVKALEPRSARPVVRPHTQR